MILLPKKEPNSRLVDEKKIAILAMSVDRADTYPPPPPCPTNTTRSNRIFCVHNYSLDTGGGYPAGAVVNFSCSNSTSTVVLAQIQGPLEHGSTRPSRMSGLVVC